MIYARLLKGEDEAALREMMPGIVAGSAEQGEGPLSKSSLSFFSRTGHAFVAEDSEAKGRACGFVLAQAVWNGVRATVVAQHIVAEDDAAEVVEALLAALVKSAYDSGVYDVRLELPASARGVLVVAQAQHFKVLDRIILERRLGSRGGA